MGEISIYTYLDIILICSGIGFVIENIWLVLRYGYFDNRNMNLPFLLGYGMAVVAIYMLLGTPKNMPDIKYYIIVLILVSAGELILGILVEKICNIHYWDYSSLPFHLTRYTSLFTSMGFAEIITVFMRFCFPQLVMYLSANDTVVMKFVGIVGVIALIFDFLYSFIRMKRTKNHYTKWRVNLIGENLYREKTV